MTEQEKADHWVQQRIQAAQEAARKTEAARQQREQLQRQQGR